MKILILKTLGIAVLFALNSFSAFSQQSVQSIPASTKSHPWMLKTDLLGFRSHSISLEGEIRLFWRISALGQIGYIEGNKRDHYWQSSGYLGRVGVKCWLGTKEAALRMNGFAIRCEAARRVWQSQGLDDKSMGQKDVAAFVGSSYTWNPFGRLVIEPNLGLGLSWWRQSFNDPNLLGNSPGIPKTPWLRPGKYDGSWSVYDAYGNLVALDGNALQINIGLMLGIRF